jgi:hypothetical protein
MDWCQGSIFTGFIQFIIRKYHRYHTLENMHKQEISGIKYFNVKLVIPFEVILI